MNFVDTHSHIHSKQFFDDATAKKAVEDAAASGVRKIICIGTDVEDSRAAIAFAKAYPAHCWAAVGIHPHEAAKLTSIEIAAHLKELAQLANDEKVVAVGECGLDFYYNNKGETFERQEALLRGQIEIAQQYNLPLSFHVRDAFDDFWRITEPNKQLRGVLHSFTDTSEQLQRALTRGLKIGINGIATFTTHTWQQELFQQISIDDFILETDAPFLTPTPKRGTINTSENVIYITKFLATLRGETEEVIAARTTATAEKLFNLV